MRRVVEWAGLSWAVWALALPVAATPPGPHPPAEAVGRRPHQREAARRRAEAMRLGHARGDEAGSAASRLAELLTHRDSQVRTAAAQSARRLKLKTPAIVRALAEAAYLASRDDHEAEQERLAGFLRSISKEALPTLREMLHAEDQRSVLAAAAAVEALGKRAASLAPDLAGLLASDEQARRFAGLFGLRQIGEGGAAAVDAVALCLRHEDFHTRYWACQAIGEMGVAARPHVDILTDMLANDVASVRKHAARALGRLGQDVGGRKAVAALTAAISDFLHPVRREAPRRSEALRASFQNGSEGYRAVSAQSEDVCRAIGRRRGPLCPGARIAAGRRCPHGGARAMGQ